MCEVILMRFTIIAQRSYYGKTTRGRGEITRSIFFLGGGGGMKAILCYVVASVMISSFVLTRRKSAPIRFRFT